MLEPGKSLEGKQKTVGRVKTATIKTIEPKEDAPEGAESFRILELVFDNIRGAVREVIGGATLKVGLSAGNVTLQSRIGRLAKGLFGWNGKTAFDEQQFVGQDIEFYVAPQEQENGTFWNIERNSLGIVGHIHEVVPTTEAVAAE